VITSTSDTSHSDTDSVLCLTPTLSLYVALISTRSGVSRRAKYASAGLLLDKWAVKECALITLVCVYVLTGRGSVPDWSACESAGES